MSLSTFLTTTDILLDRCIFLVRSIFFLLVSYLFRIQPSTTYRPTPKSPFSVLVTGVSSGIGKDIGLAFAKKGYIVFAGVRNLADGEKVRDEFHRWRREFYETHRNTSPENPTSSSMPPPSSSTHPSLVGELVSPTMTNGDIVPILFDVNNPSHIKDALDTVKEFSSLYGIKFVALINNAGINNLIPLEVISMTALQSLFDTNLFAPFKITQMFLPLLRENKGRVVNIGSVASFLTHMPLYGPYAASKAAMRAMTDSWSAEVKSFGVQMSIIEPGMIQTRIVETMVQGAARLDFSDPSNLLLPDPDTIDIYKNFSRDFISKVGKAQNGFSLPDVVTFCAFHAVQSRWPMAVYHAGLDAKVSKAFVNMFGTRILGWIVHNFG